MILYQRVSSFRNFLNFLAANGFAIGAKQPHPLLAIKAIRRQIGCKVAFVQDHDWIEAPITALDSQDM